MLGTKQGEKHCIKLTLCAKVQLDKRTKSFQELVKYVNKHSASQRVMRKMAGKVDLSPLFKLLFTKHNVFYFFNSC